VNRQTVPYFGCSDCKVPTAQSGPRPGDSEAAGLSRSEMPSAWQRRHRHGVNSQVRRRQSMQALVDRHHQFVDNTLTNGKPVKFIQDGRDVIKLLCRHASCCVLYSLLLVQQTVIHTVQKTVTVV